MQYNVILIRHGKTEGNIRGIYVGVTDEPLCEQGIAQLEARTQSLHYPKVDYVFISPMLRCRQTMQKIYQDIPYRIIPELKEYNFGVYEGKTFQDLQKNSNYQRWIDSLGKGTFPGGEDIDKFKERCCLGFENVMGYVIQNCIYNSAVIVHAGTIMSILERYAPEPMDFFHYNVKNCDGYRLIINEEEWVGAKKIEDVMRL